MRKLFWSIVALGLMAATADAQTTSARRCTTVNGIYTCTTTTDGENSTSRMTCQHYGGGNSDCTTDSQEKAPRPPSMQEVKVDFGAEKAKAETRARAGYRDPNARVLGCGAGYRMTERDGCQPR